MTSEAESLPQVILDFRGYLFEFQPTTHTSDSLQGHFVNYEAIRNDLQRLDAELAEEECWYLDGDGYRWEDDELFKRSPWSLVVGNSKVKIVNRFLDAAGNARFCLTPWARIGDEFERSTPK